jgi:iron only hydrogenase large subunit-like protein
LIHRPYKTRKEPQKEKKTHVDVVEDGWTGGGGAVEGARKKKNRKKRRAHESIEAESEKRMPSPVAVKENHQQLQKSPSSSFFLITIRVESIDTRVFAFGVFFFFWREGTGGASSVSLC